MMETPRPRRTPATGSGTSSGAQAGKAAAAIIANIAGKTEDEFVEMAAQIGRERGLAGLELNLSCPNVSGGVDFATNPEVTRRVVSRVRIPVTLLFDVMRALNDNLTAYESAWGEIKRPEQEEPPE